MISIEHSEALVSLGYLRGSSLWTKPFGQCMYVYADKPTGWLEKNQCASFFWGGCSIDESEDCLKLCLWSRQTINFESSEEEHPPWTAKKLFIYNVKMFEAYSRPAIGPDSGVKACTTFLNGKIIDL